MEEGAYLCGPDGRFYLGEGPFRESAEPPSNSSAFYINNYELTEKTPWKIPSRLKELSPQELPVSTLETAPLKKEHWIVPDSADFAHVFHEMLEHMHQGVLQKAVPVVTETWERTPGDRVPGHLLAAFSHQGNPLFPYAWWKKEEGFAGASPEFLFLQEKRELRTMALAGTARQEDAALFLLDRKEIREHEYVVQSLMEKLSAYGKVSRSPRQIIDLKKLIHFLTFLGVELDREIPLNELVEKLHPTPALGPLPRTQETLALQYGWRDQLHCPSLFGAPFGLLHEGRFQCLVAIRDILWDQHRLYLPAGCGIIAESKLTQEWNELQLKRHSVRRKILS